MDVKRFSNKVVVITGAGRGLGRAYAISLANQGAKIVVNDPGVDPDGQGGNQALAPTLAEEINATNGIAIASTVSITEPDGAQTLIESALEEFGQVDVLINNAGFLRDRTFSKATLEDMNSLISVHLLGAIHCTHAAWPAMTRNGYGRVILTTSAAGLYGNFGQSAYAAAKMGLIGLMNTLKLEGARNNILINTIAPLAETRLLAQARAVSDNLSLPLDTIVALVCHLASAECSISGTIFEAAADKLARVELLRTELLGVHSPDESGNINDVVSVVDQLNRTQPLYSFNSATTAMEDWLKGSPQ